VTWWAKREWAIHPVPAEPKRTDLLQASALQFKGEGRERKRKKQKKTLALQNN